MSTHTPGPWTAINHDNLVDDAMRTEFGADARRWIVSADRMRTVCGVNGPCYFVPVDQVDANARLISAAPDMLAALKLCMRWWGFEADDTGGLATNAARAAIAKAEGR